MAKFTFDPTDKEGNFQYYEVSKDGEFIGDLSYHKKGNWLGRVPASRANPDGFFGHPEKKAILKAFEEECGSHGTTWGPKKAKASIGKEQLKAQLAAHGITVRGNFVKKSEIRAFIAKAANTHELVKKMADKAHVSEEKLEHYLLGGPGSKDPTFTKELHDNTGMPDNWESIDDLDAWMAKMGLNSREILKMFKAAQASMATADEDWHIPPGVFADVVRLLGESIISLKGAQNLMEEHHQRGEALAPKFRDHANKAFKEIIDDIGDLGEHLGGNKTEAIVTKAEYSDADWKNLLKELNKISLNAIKAWAESAYGDDASVMSKSEIIDAFLEQNGQQAIDHINDGGSVSDLF